jgi:hypothetical protein
MPYLSLDQSLDAFPGLLLDQLWKAWEGLFPTEEGTWLDSLVAPR